MELSQEARAKSAFVTPMDKFEFTRCPFGLTQAPAYFQKLINKVIKGLPFAFGYLDDVLIHSPGIRVPSTAYESLVSETKRSIFKTQR